jgi:hypothetical protein
MARRPAVADDISMFDVSMGEKCARTIARCGASARELVERIDRWPKPMSPAC